MRRVAGLLLVLAMLLPGCSTPDAPPLVTPSAPPPAEAPGVGLVALDGRWSFDATAAAQGLGESGIALLGEASLGRAAVPFAALDPTAARILGVAAPLPAPGEILLDETAARALEAKVGDALDARTLVWPTSRVTTAFEMDRVRGCDPASPALLCVSASGEDGKTRLKLDVPPGASDLRYHPDVVELGADDYPAFWNGSFLPPSGAPTPFATAAISRAELHPPGLVAGHVHEGEWTIEFTLDLNGRRATGAVAGFVTFRAPGFGAFDTELLRFPDAGEQTARVLADARAREATLRVSSIVPDDDAFHRLGARALVAPEDARALLNVTDGNATALVLRTPATLPDRSEARDPALRQLVVRRLGDAPPEDASRSPVLSWAPQDEAAFFETRVPPGGALRLNGTTLAPGVRLLAATAGDLPWTILPGGHWPTAAEARAGIGGAPHLVLASADLAREAGIDPAKAKYARLEIDSGVGPRSVFVMGLVEGGPPRAVWASAALLYALGAPAGPRALGDDVPVVD